VALTLELADDLVNINALRGHVVTKHRVSFCLADSFLNVVKAVIVSILKLNSGLTLKVVQGHKPW